MVNYNIMWLNRLNGSNGLVLDNNLNPETYLREMDAVFVADNYNKNNQDNNIIYLVIQP